MEKNKKCRILLIDNDEMDRIFFRDLFWIHGEDDLYEITCARSFGEALELIEEGDFSIIFFDSLIPEKEKKNDIDGQIERTYSFIKEMKSNEKYSEIKLIVYSSIRDKKIKKKLKSIGVHKYIYKGDLLPKEIISLMDKINGCHN